MESTGNSGKPRLVAMMVDGLVAAAIGILIAAKTPGLTTVSSAVVCAAVYLAYFLVGEGPWGRTLGKLLTGLVVRRLNGEPCGWAASTVRTALRLIEVNPLLLGAVPGGLLVMLSSRKQRLGDML